MSEARRDAKSTCVQLLMLQVRNFEKVGLTRQQAEALTEHLTEVLCTHKEKLSEAYVTKAQLEKVRLSQNPAAPASVNRI